MNRLKDINTHCLQQFRAHWDCLENWNHQLYQCRIPERKLNKCVFDNIGLEKTIPGAPKNEVPVHLRPDQIMADYSQRDPEDRWFTKKMREKFEHLQAEKDARNAAKAAAEQ